MSNLKRFLALTLAMLMVVGAMAVSAKSFTDVASTDSYAEAVDVLSELGVIAGTSTDEFSPNALVSREQMAMFIARLATAQPALFAVDAAPIFKDQKDATYNAAIHFAYTNSIIAGRTATEFDGPATVTLQEAAAMLTRALGYGNKSNNAAYPFSYMVIANEIGLLAGLEDVVPTAELTRGEVATMLYNALFAPKATRTILYTPDGQDWIVAIPDTFTDNDPATAYDTLAVKTWKCTVVSGAYIDATLKAGIAKAPTAATKSLKDPVAFNKGVSGNISFASLTKYFADDATADDMLGVELQMITRNGKIIKIDVVGSKAVTTSASYNKDTDVLTVDGNAYNLSTYLTDTYPADSDNCFFKFNGSNRIVRITTDIDTAYAQIANGFFTFEVINEGLATQMIVYKPQSFAQLTDANADGALEIGGAVVTSNTTGAVKDDYVTYFNGGDKNVVVVAKATKSGAVKVASISLTANKATMVDGSTAPAKAATPIPGSNLMALSIGQTVYVYTVDGVALKTEAYAPNAGYTANTYFRVLNKAATVSTDPFNPGTAYSVQVVDATGAKSAKVITHVNGLEIIADDAQAGTPAGKIEWPDVQTAVTNAVITFADTTKIYTYARAGADAAKFDGYTVVNGANVYAANTFSTIANKATTTIANVLFDGQNGIYTVGTGGAGATSFVLTDNTKIVISGTDGKFLTFTGKAFTKLAANNILTDISFVTYVNASSINELVYLYATANVATTAIIDAASTTPTQKPYLFVDVESITATSVTYKAINLATGATESITYTDADSNYANVLLAATELLNKGIVVDVQTSKTLATSKIATTEQIFKLTASGYVSVTAPSALLYQTSGTKYYKWNADTSTYDAKTFADFDKNVSYSGLVVPGTNGNAAYVIVRSALGMGGALSTVATLSDSTPGTQAGTSAAPIAWEISVANAKATLGLADITASAGATINLYTNANFTDDAVTGTATTALAVGNTTVYVKVTSQDLLTVTHYAVTITRAAA